MKPYQINCAIAEVLGATWKMIDWDSPWGTAPPKRRILSFSAHDNPRWDNLDGLSEGVGADVPNYHGDLNACAKMEEFLAPTKDERECCEGRWTEYGDALCCVCGLDKHDRIWFSWEVYHAKPPQRCEAFLRVMGRWVDQEAAPAAS